MISVRWSLLRQHIASSVALAATIVLASALVAAFLNAIVVVSGQMAGANAVPSELGASLLGWSLTLTAVCAAILVGQAVSFTLDARRRELALFALLGATPRQIAQLSRWETIAIGAACSAAGWLLGWPTGIAVLAWLRHVAYAPPIGPSPTPTWWSFAVVVAGMVLLCWLGSAGPAKRAGQVEPLAAVDDAVAPSRPMTGFRWFLAAALVAGAVAAFVIPASGQDLMASTLLLNCVLVGALGALAPMLIPPLARIFGAVFEAPAPAMGLLAARHARFAVRRTAALAVPIIVLTGMCTGLFTILATARAIDRAHATTAEQIAAVQATMADNRNAMIALLGAGALLAIFSVAVSQLASARERRGEFAVLERSGATVRQLVGTVVLETVLVLGVAAVALVADVLLVRSRVDRALAQLGEHISAAIPIGELGTVFGAGAVVAMAAAAAGVLRATRLSEAQPRADI